MKRLGDELKASKSDELSFSEAIDSLDSTPSANKLPSCSAVVPDDNNGHDDDDTETQPLQKKFKEDV